jgi:hypothetical protein
MSRFSNRMIKYEAPEGFVYDYKEPKDDKHLMVKYLFLSRSDSIDNYILVKDPHYAN